MMLKRLKHAKLAAAGFWTSGGKLRPLLHFVGLAGIFPSLFITINFLLRINGSDNNRGDRGSGSRGDTHVNWLNLLVWLPMNLISILLCDGIPHMKILAYANVFFGLWIATSSDSELL